MGRETTDLAICFADVCDSTRFFVQHGDDDARSIIGHALDVLADVVEAHDGTVIKTIGDEIMATFPKLMASVSAVTKMPSAVKQDELLARHGIEIRVGMCFGSVLRESDGDVYGDAVNTASRLVDWASPSQVLTTESSLEHLPDFYRTRARSLGPTMLRGKEEPVDVVHLVDEQSGDQLTVVDRGQEPESTESAATLALTYRGETVTISGDPYQIGRGKNCDLIVADSRVSRRHARIERRQGAFLLVDSSTNGTYVKIGEEDAMFLHRDQLRLHGTGRVGLGRHPESDEAEPLRFECSNTGNG